MRNIHLTASDADVAGLRAPHGIAIGQIKQALMLWEEEDDEYWPKRLAYASHCFYLFKHLSAAGQYRSRPTP